MSWEWAPDNVRVNCLEPGAVVTPASRFANSETEQRVAHYVQQLKDTLAGADPR